LHYELTELLALAANVFAAVRGQGGSPALQVTFESRIRES